MATTARLEDWQLRLACHPALLEVHSDWIPAPLAHLNTARSSGRSARCMSQLMLRDAPQLSLPLSTHWRWLSLRVSELDAMASGLASVCTGGRVRRAVMRREVAALKGWLGHEAYTAAFTVDPAWSALHEILAHATTEAITARSAASLGRGILLARARQASAAHALRLCWRYPRDAEQWASSVDVDAKLAPLIDSWIANWLETCAP